MAEEAKTRQNFGLAVAAILKTRLQDLLKQAIQRRRASSKGISLKGSITRGFQLPDMTSEELQDFFDLVYKNQHHEYMALLILPTNILLPDEYKARQPIPNYQYNALAQMGSLVTMFLCNACIKYAKDDDDPTQPVNFRAPTSLQCSSCNGSLELAREMGFPDGFPHLKY